LIGILSHTLRQNKFINNYPPAPGGFGGQVGVGFQSCIAVLGGRVESHVVICLKNNLDVVVIWAYI